MLKLSIQDGFSEIPACWRTGGDEQQRLKQRYRVKFSPCSFVLQLDALVMKSGINLYYDTRFCDVIKQGNRISAVMVENKSGRSALACCTVVDASGDADVCDRAEEPTVSLHTNVRAGWFYFYDGSDVKLVPLSGPYDPYGQQIPQGGRGYAGDRAEDVTAQVVDTRMLTMEKLEALRREQDANTIYPVSLPTIPSFRMTRRLVGRVELKEKDDRRYFEDMVGMAGDWRQAGPIYYLPLRCLTAVNTVNLITAGRCISSGETCWDVTRAIPVCAVTGEAAGTAAALACQHTDGDLGKLSVPHLQTQLKEQRVIIEKRFASRGNDVP